MYQTSTGFLLSDGRRSLNNSGFQQMTDSTSTAIPACSSTTCQCVYLNTNFNTSLSVCTAQKNFLCEFKGTQNKQILESFLTKRHCVAIMGTQNEKMLGGCLLLKQECSKYGPEAKSGTFKPFALPYIEGMALRVEEKF